MAVGHSTAQGSITADPLQRQEIQATDAQGSGGGAGFTALRRSISEAGRASVTLAET